MKKPNIFSKKLLSIYFLIVLSTSLVVLILHQFNPITSIAQLRTKQEDVKPVKFFNKTKSFEIVNYKISGKQMELILRNNYDKSINGFYIVVGSRGEGSTSYVELIYSDFKTEILPNETHTYRTVVEEKLYAEGLTVSAVLFTDHTGDGDSEVVTEMQDVREGEKFQLSKGLEGLKTITAPASENISSELEELKNHLSLLETEDKTKSMAYNSGLYYGKGRMIRYIERLEINGNTDRFAAKRKLSELQSKLEKYISKL